MRTLICYFWTDQQRMWSLTCILLFANLSIHSGKEVQALLSLGVVLTKDLLPQLCALEQSQVEI